MSTLKIVKKHPKTDLAIKKKNLEISKIIFNLAKFPKFKFYLKKN